MRRFDRAGFNAEARRGGPGSARFLYIRSKLRRESLYQNNSFILESLCVYNQDLRSILIAVKND